jgi:ATP-dependent exoDNAse (exonuclease V) beta subunit
LQRKTIVGNLKILWLDGEEMDFGLPKVLVDNSSAVEGFGVEAKSVYDQKKQEELLDNVNVLYVALTRGGAIVCHFKYEFVQKRRSAQNNMCTFFLSLFE